MNENLKGLQSAYVDWWEALQEDKGGKARLRRCATLTEVAMEPAYYDLLRRCQQADWPGHEEAIMALAALAAHVKSNQEKNMALLMADTHGAKREGNERVKESRFQRLLRVEAKDKEALMRDLIRVIRQLDGQANLADLAVSLWFWNDRTKRQWAKDYFLA